jgi:hypothetical protein
VLAALVCGGFATLPRLAVRAVRPRYGSPMGDTHLSNIDGVMLYGDDFAVPGDAVLVRLIPCKVDARSALRHALIENPNISKSNAWQAVRRVCPRTSKRAFDHDWRQARLDVGLPARGRAGRPKTTARIS